MRQIQESSKVSTHNLEKLDKHLQQEGRQISDDILSEIQRVMYRIRDFEVLYNICEGSFSFKNSKFDVKKELNFVSDTLKAELLRREIKLEVSCDPSLPDTVKGCQ